MSHDCVVCVMGWLYLNDPNKANSNSLTRAHIFIVTVGMTREIKHIWRQSIKYNVQFHSYLYNLNNSRLLFLIIILKYFIISGSSFLRPSVNNGPDRESFSMWPWLLMVKKEEETSSYLCTSPGCLICKSPRHFHLISKWMQRLQCKHKVAYVQLYCKLHKYFWNIIISICLIWFIRKL